MLSYFVVNKLWSVQLKHGPSLTPLGNLTSLVNTKNYGQNAKNQRTQPIAFDCGHSVGMSSVSTDFIIH